MKKTALIISILCSFLMLAAQQKSYPDYSKPVDFPIYLSGSFGELRANSFHAGIDIRTQGVEGKKIYSTGDGYVSRIGVSPWGYGKVLYINHLEGYTTVYAHLSAFADSIAAYVKNEQYERKNYSVTLYPEKERFSVKKGQLIGFSGNSGSSGGPHLHYEIRDAASQDPMNPLFFGIKTKDNSKPVINEFAVYPLSPNAYIESSYEPIYLKTVPKGGDYVINPNSVLKGIGTFAFGISAIDKFDDVPNNNGVYSIALFVESRPVFKIVFDRFSYDETRYVNSLIDYAHYIENSKRIVRTDIDPFNRLKLYDNKDGEFTINQGDTVSFRFVVSDFQGNVTSLPFTIIGSSENRVPRMLKQYDKSWYTVRTGEQQTILLEGFSATIPKDAFYRDQHFKTGYRIQKGFASPIFQLGETKIPVHKAISIKIRPFDSIQSKQLYIVHFSKTGKETAIEGTRDQAFFVAKVCQMGEFALKIDSIKPIITPHNFTRNANVSAKNQITLKITDKESGIKTYTAWLNEKWLLMEYDAKNNLLIYDFDERLLKGENNFRLEVVDVVGNKTVFTSKLYR
ncbi:MAG: M23 family metallopeptidase [Lentimicrobiaceae bacterium]|jgi:hypothetical protein|nr:M23 family metallopeptidase [Lentimicrobiaceae bacterium]